MYDGSVFGTFVYVVSPSAELDSAWQHLAKHKAKRGQKRKQRSGKRNRQGFLEEVDYSKQLIYDKRKASFSKRSRRRQVLNMI